MYKKALQDLEISFDVIRSLLIKTIPTNHFRWLKLHNWNPLERKHQASSDIILVLREWWSGLLNIQCRESLTSYTNDLVSMLWTFFFYFFKMYFEKPMKRLTTSCKLIVTLLSYKQYYYKYKEIYYWSHTSIWTRHWSFCTITKQHCIYEKITYGL